MLMGKVVSYGERLLLSGNSRRDFLAGMALALLLIGVSASAAWALVSSFQRLPFWLSFLATAALASTTLATRGLLDAVKLIEAPLRAGNIGDAREKLSQIVGRETAELNQDKVLRASLESLSESTCDGIVAPLFYLFLGGVPLAMAYKAISTLDSMIGYRTERYFYFGKFAARLDDAANFIPARLTAGFLVLATLTLRLNGARAWRIAWRDHANHLSPNAGYPEAALAGAFGIRLGGPSIYFGKKIDKPYLGDDLTPVKIGMLKEGRVLCLVTAILSLATFALLSTARG
jgi:adenosylcobinamide-phosphate synthase